MGYDSNCNTSQIKVRINVPHNICMTPVLLTLDYIIMAEQLLV